RRVGRAAPQRPRDRSPQVHDAELRDGGWRHGWLRDRVQTRGALGGRRWWELPLARQLYPRGGGRRSRAGRRGSRAARRGGTGGWPRLLSRRRPVRDQRRGYVGRRLAQRQRPPLPALLRAEPPRGPQQPVAVRVRPVP